MKHYLRSFKFVFLLTTMTLTHVFGQSSFDFVETFEKLGLTGTNYRDGAFEGNNGITWTYAHVTGEQSFPIDNEGLLLRNAGVPSSIKSQTLTGGIKDFQVHMRKAFSGTGNRQIGLFINGQQIAQSQVFGNFSGGSDEVFTFEVPEVNIAGDFVLEIRHLIGSGTEGRQLVIDNISWNGYDAEVLPPGSLALWDFTGEPGNQEFTSGAGSSNISALNFTRGSALNANTGTNSINSSNWSLSENSYFSFGLEVEEGFAADLDNLIISSRSSGTGPGNLALRFSGDNFETDLASWSQSGTNFANQTIDLSGLGRLTGKVEFRIYITNTVSAGGGTVASGGTFRVNNSLKDGVSVPVQFNGTLSELPPPTPVVLANWNFAGAPGNQISTPGTSEENGILVNDFTRGSGINPASAANSISSNGWNTGDDRFFTFGFSVAPGKLLDLQSLQIGSRSSDTGPRDLALRYSGDNFSSDLATWTSANQFFNQTIDLSNLTNLSGNVEFRIVSTSSTAVNGGEVSSGGTFRITNFFPDNQGTRFIGFVKSADGVVVPTISIEPAVLDFGLISIRDEKKILTYALTGSNLTGPLTITAPAPLTLSKDGLVFSEQLVFTIDELTVPQNVSVKLDNSTAGNVALSISHQTAGTSPVQLQVTASIFDPFDIKENFNTSCPDGLPAGWEAFSVKGDQVWACTTFGRAGTSPTASAPFGVQISGFSGTAQLNEDWLITPSFDLTEFDFPLLSFWSRTAFAGPRMRLMISNDFEGADPSVASWTELSDRFAQENVWTFSEEINLAAYKGKNVRIAFVYQSNPEEGAARWTLDDFTLKNSETAPAPFLNSSLGNLDYWHFGVVPAGSNSSQVRTFNFSLSDGTEGLTISGGNGFEFSKNGTEYSPSLVYTADEAAANNQVSVRFAPSSEGAFTGKIILKSGDLVLERGFLTGATVNKEETFDVVTWNIEWFGSSTFGPSNVELQLQNVKTIIEDLDADVYAFQEITDLNKFAELANSLPDYRGFFSTAVSQAGNFEDAQKLAFLYKTSTVDSVSTKILLQDVKSEDLVNYPGPTNRFWASGRLPFLFEVKTNINGVQQNINLINIHARSNGGGESAANQRYAMRKYDVDVLKDSLDLYYGDVPLIILGDYNDDLDEPVADQNAPTVNTSETSYISYINDVANYVPATISLSNAGLRTFIAFENVIDHMILSNEMAYDWLVNSERIVVPFDLVQNYQNTTSDHLPVKVRFQLKCDLEPGLATASETKVCAGNNTITLSLIGGVFTSFLGWEASVDGGANWTFLEGSTGEANFVVNNIEEKSLFRAILDSDICQAIVTNSVEVLVNKLPTPAIRFEQGKLVTLQGDYTYMWYKDGALLTTTIRNEIWIQGAGIYQVTIIGKDGCSATSDRFIFPADKQAYFRVFPNPATTRVNVAIENPQGTYQLELRNSMGHVLRTLIIEGETAEFDVMGLRQGVYLVRITDSFGNTSVERLLVK
jgi:endonuclease/exonuclease/phosphatase family metal-dependent hydrolase